MQAELLCQHLLLQLASQDALARLKFTELGKDTENFDFTMSKYFEDQKHTSLHQFLKHYIRDQDSPAHCKKECFYQTEKGALLQVIIDLNGKKYVLAILNVLCNTVLSTFFNLGNHLWSVANKAC